MASRAPQDIAENRRAYPRVAVAMPAFLQVGGQRYAVQLLDLSAGGAKVSGPAAVSSGTAVALDCGTLRRSAVVRWHNGGTLGLCFDSQLDARELTALAARANALDALLKTRSGG